MNDEKKFKRVIKYKKLLEILPRCNKKVFNKIIKNSKKEFIYTICECVLNVLKGNIKISKKSLEKLKEKKQILRKLLKKSNIENKKKIIQKGGFLEILIPSIISGLASIIGSAISNNE